MAEVQLTYALETATGRMRHITEVPNGLASQCVCPGCGARLIARNGGAMTHPHFAHYQGTACQGAHESELHALCKEILAQERAVMLPPYGTVFEGALQRFQHMEVEERRDCSALQPDVVGLHIDPATGKESRLWIEVKVTHAVDDQKRQRIRQLGIACLEIDLSAYREVEVTRQRLTQFLLTSSDYRRWISNPRLEQRLAQVVEQREAYSQKQQTRHQAGEAPPAAASAPPPEANLVPYRKCHTCPYHTTRQHILHEMLLQKIPATIRNIFLKGNLQDWQHSNVSAAPMHPNDYLLVLENTCLHLPTQSPDMHHQPVPQARMLLNRRIVNFLQHDIPLLVNAYGTRCRHTGQFLEKPNGRHQVVCKREGKEENQ